MINNCILFLFTVRAGFHSDTERSSDDEQAPSPSQAATNESSSSAASEPMHEVEGDAVPMQIATFETPNDNSLITERVVVQTVEADISVEDLGTQASALADLSKNLTITLVLH